MKKGIPGLKELGFSYDPIGALPGRGEQAGRLPPAMSEALTVLMGHHLHQRPAPFCLICPFS